MDLLIGHPERIALVAAFFVLIAALSGRRGDGVWGRTARPCFLAALAWSSYAVWERFASRSANNPRVDLLLIFPFLLIISVLAPIVSLLRARRYRG